MFDSYVKLPEGTGNWRHLPYVKARRNILRNGRDGNRFPEHTPCHGQMGHVPKFKSPDVCWLPEWIEDHRKCQLMSVGYTSNISTDPEGLYCGVPLS